MVQWIYQTALCMTGGGSLRTTCPPTAACPTFFFFNFQMNRSHNTHRRCLFYKPWRSAMWRVWGTLNVGHKKKKKRRRGKKDGGGGPDFVCYRRSIKKPSLTYLQCYPSLNYICRRLGEKTQTGVLNVYWSKIKVWDLIINHAKINLGTQETLIQWVNLPV